MQKIFQDARLRETLKKYVAGTRWFRAKTRTISAVAIEEVFRLPKGQNFILVLKIDYVDAESESEFYILPVSLKRERTQNGIGQVEGVVVADALGDAEFRTALLELITCEHKLHGITGVLAASRTAAFEGNCGSEDAIESSVSRAEQSNTSIIYRDRYILKLFRRIEPGINPDIEIGTFLTERGFQNTPAVLGSFSYYRDSEIFAAGILQSFVRNEGDAWKYTLEQLAAFFKRALADESDPPRRKAEHPLELASEEIPARIRELACDYLESAVLLGRRTAEMHAALADPNAGPDFAPEPFTEADARQLHRDLMAQADITFELLRRRQGALSGAAAEPARQVLHLENRIAELFRVIESKRISAVRIRHHGDYHLGQVLYTGRDFMIIDFEGEPARPLADRRAKAIALRDVAGMVRSFQYAAFAALFGQVPGVDISEQSRKRVESWAGTWNAYVSATYLRAYFETAEQKPFVPIDTRERRMLLDAFLLQKALYEVAYELNNRPDWLQIPLTGILSLIQ